MNNLDKSNSIGLDDRDLFSDLTSTFDLGTQTIIGNHEDEIMDDLFELMSEMGEDRLN